MPTNKYYNFCILPQDIYKPTSLRIVPKTRFPKSLAHLPLVSSKNVDSSLFFNCTMLTLSVKEGNVPLYKLR